MVWYLKFALSQRKTVLQLFAIFDSMEASRNGVKRLEKPKLVSEKHNYVPVVLGNINVLLKTSRLKFNLSQLEASHALGLKKSQYLSNIERGLCSPSLQTILALAEMFKIPSTKIIDVMIDDYSRALKVRVYGK